MLVSLFFMMVLNVLTFFEVSTRLLGYTGHRCNMAIEAGGKNGIIPADDITTAYVDSRNKCNKPYEIFHADANVRIRV